MMMLISMAAVAGSFLLAVQQINLHLIAITVILITPNFAHTYLPIPISAYPICDFFRGYKYDNEYLILNI